MLIFCILEGVLWQALKRILRQTRTKGRFGKWFYWLKDLMREGMKKDWNLYNSCNSLAAFLCQCFHWLSLPKKQWCFKLLSGAWIYLTELLNVSQLLAWGAWVYTHVLLYKKNKRAGIILSSLWSAIVSMPFEFWVTVLRVLEGSHWNLLSVAPK